MKFDFVIGYSVELRNFAELVDKAKAFQEKCVRIYFKNKFA
jgi:hypothetical protein